MPALRLSSPPGPPHGEVEVPGSKSYTNRALIAAAQAAGESVLIGPSPSEDTALLAAACGVEILRDREAWKVRGGHPKPFHGEIDAGAAGTTLRFLVSLCCAVPCSDVVLRGSERMHERPIGDLVAAWRDLGATIDYLGREGCPPLRIRAGEPTADRVTIRGDTSSQFLSSLLLAAPSLPRGLTVEPDGALTSGPYVEMTLACMRAFGVDVARPRPGVYRVEPGQRYAATRYEVEGDASAAAYFHGIAAISGGDVRIRKLPAATVQGDAGFPALLDRLGGEADLSPTPDLAPPLAVVAATAPGKTRLHGLATLRRKESDRIAALHEGLAAVGIRSDPGPDSLVVHGGQPRPGRIRVHDDHRIAMAFAMLGAAVDGIEVEDPDVVAKSFPGFWSELRALGIGMVEVQ